MMIVALALAGAVHAQECASGPDSTFIFFAEPVAREIMKSKAVKVDVNDHDYDSLKVLLNDDVVLSPAMTRLTDLGPKKQLTITLGPGKSDAEIIVPQGKHDLVVRTYKGNQCVWESSREVTGGDSRVSAIIVGINDYKAMRHLKYAEEDAKQFETLLRKRVKDGDLTVVRLLGAEATKTNIEKALFDATRQASDQGTVLLYFSGHGLLIEDGKVNAYLVPYDAESADYPGYFIAHSAVLNDLKEKTHARHRIVILDSCFSGLPLVGPPPTVDASYIAKSITPTNTPTLLEDAANDTAWMWIPPEVVWFSGSSVKQVSYEAQDDLRHGVFTHHLLEAGEPPLSYSETFENVKAALQAYTKQKKWTQTPELVGATDTFQTLKFPLTADEQ
jgi:hypothetical protein